jgi:hypothetical protein
MVMVHVGGNDSIECIMWLSQDQVTRYSSKRSMVLGWRIGGLHKPVKKCNSCEA